MKGDIWRLHPAEIKNSHHTRVVDIAAWQLTASGWCLLLSSESINGRFEILEAGQDWFMTDNVVKLDLHGYSGASTGAEAVDGWLMTPQAQLIVVAGMAQIYNRHPQEMLHAFTRWQEEQKENEVSDQ